MKTLIDRMNAMYEQDYAFRDVCLLTTAAEDEAETPTRAETGLTGWLDCYLHVVELLCGCSEVMRRCKVISLQGGNAVGAGSRTLCCEKAAGVSLISSDRC